MATFYFYRYWETQYVAEVEAESLEEACRIVNTEGADWDHDEGNDEYLRTVVHDEDDEPLAEVDYDYEIVEDYRSEEDE